jgi:quinol monooxygenase YgiN
MANVLVTFAVPDFEQWKQKYYDAEEQRQSAGCTGSQVYSGDLNSNDVILVQNWESIEKFEAFSNSPRLLEIQEKSGVSNLKYDHLTGVTAN